jgi:TNF receptor-associated factor 3
MEDQDYQKLKLASDYVSQAKNTIETLKSNISEAHRNREMLQNKLDLLKHSVIELKSRVHEKTDEQRTMDERFSKYLTCLQELESRVTQREVTNYNGTLVFRINDYVNRFMKARQGIEECVYSEPFYTSIDGYKMRLQVYLNGARQYKGQYMSVFLQVLPGEYDRVLKLPFNGKVDVKLMNQVDTGLHIGKVFNTLNRNPSVADGCELFSSLASVQDESRHYLYDDSIVFKVAVTDLEDK